MAAVNVVRFRVKPGREAEVIDIQRKSHRDFAGFKRYVLIKTGERSYCVVGEWDSSGTASRASSPRVRE
jgi:heme-degrading monooxygenase HmoA